MRRTYRLSRRLFLSELGRSTVAVAILGTGLATGCSSADDDSTTATTGGGGGRGEATIPPVADEGAEAAADAPPAGQLQWERVNLGFVSAYVLARGDEVAIVDTGTAGSGGQIEGALDSLGFAWDDVDHVIVTHAHGDHVGSLDEVLTSATAAMGYAGVGDIEQLSAPRDLVAVSGGDEVFGLQIIGTPGHTPGHISVFDVETGLLVAGDAMVTENGMLAGPAPDFTEDLATAHASVKVMAQELVSTILVGHGDPITTGAGQQLTDLAATL
jgi:glyoxylase-like metal-dependent hydrolase (beta-lactamase superfamily II)